jgi:hypothetical protein
MKTASKQKASRQVRSTHHGGRRLFHYTIVRYLPAIIISGEIRTAGDYMGIDERPAVWCSYNQDWEKTAKKFSVDEISGRVRSGTKESTHLENGGLARIEVHPQSCPFDWRYFVANSRIDPDLARSLYKAGIKDGAHPREWRVSFEPIASDQWIAIEVYDGEDWTSLPNETWQKAPAMLCL